MTKESYFDMCSQLNSEPIESEIPVEISDFPELVQTCFIIYDRLSDIIDSMNGNYYGKDYSIVFKLFELYYIDNIDDQRLCMDILRSMDISRSSLIISKKASAKK